jgi:hypothetical protein
MPMYLLALSTCIFTPNSSYTCGSMWIHGHQTTSKGVFGSNSLSLLIRSIKYRLITKLIAQMETNLRDDNNFFFHISRIFVSFAFHLSYVEWWYIYDWRSFQDFVAGHADNTTDISGACASTIIASRLSWGVRRSRNLLHGRPYL